MTPTTLKITLSPKLRGELEALATSNMRSLVGEATYALARYLQLKGDIGPNASSQAASLPTPPMATKPSPPKPAKPRGRPPAPDPYSRGPMFIASSISPDPLRSRKNRSHMNWLPKVLRRIPVDTDNPAYLDPDTGQPTRAAPDPTDPQYLWFFNINRPPFYLKPRVVYDLYDGVPEFDERPAVWPDMADYTATHTRTLNEAGGYDDDVRFLRRHNLWMDTQHNAETGLPPEPWPYELIPIEEFFDDLYEQPSLLEDYGCPRHLTSQLCLTTPSAFSAPPNDPPDDHIEAWNP